MTLIMPANPELSKVRETFKLGPFNLGKRMLLGDLSVAFQYFMEASEKYEKMGQMCTTAIGQGLMILN